MKAVLSRASARWRKPGRRWVVPGAVLLGAAAGAGYGLVQTPQYAATSYVIVVPAEKSDPAAAVGFATAYGRVALDLAVTGDAPVWAGVSARTLRESVQTATSPDAPMIAVTARSPQPSKAVAMADGVARALVVNSTHAQGGTGVKVLPFSRATAPTAPVSPSAPLAAMVGGSAGGLIGSLALLVRPRRTGSGERYAAVPGPAGAQSQAAAQAPRPETV
ncbi:hypothetical protein [Streptomyces purpureus]|uniref:Lipopolysaccharide biosynthesis protein n=1 Tax=Streptomyces purpureus TaxID=1951 RepID=A0A918HBZ3_9ACTN|nr:hypothetical protein [Streptomyces purpureus]GGT52887.1 hypothetical protein GCM10014713_53570 [Streptomyces purpureus]